VSSEDGNVETLSEDSDVREPATGTGRTPSAPAERIVIATAELLWGISNASAEAFHSLSLALEPKVVVERGLQASILRGLREGNGRYFRMLAQTSSRVFGTIRGAAPSDHRSGDLDVATVAHGLDYERLAHLVAAEMTKEAPSTVPQSPM
jgi:hypothetical protein